MAISDYFPETTIVLEKGKKPYDRVTPAKRKVSDDISNLVSGIMSMFSKSSESNIPEVKAESNTKDPEKMVRNTVPTTETGFRVNVPTAPGYPQVPDSISQSLGNELDRYGLATEAARVLTHPREQTYTPNEVSKFGRENYNGGENPMFNTVGTTLQGNGTYDMGLMRNNTQPFKELQGSHKWNTILKENGITNVSDLDDQDKSIRYAKILGDYYEQDLGLPRWSPWFAAPQDLRSKQP